MKIHLFTMANLTTLILALLLLILVLLFVCGCCAGNAEMIQWNAQGNKIAQARTGWFYFAYWFGMEEPSIEYRNGQFRAYAKTMTGKSDPNSIAATGQAMGEAGRAFIKP